MKLLLVDERRRELQRRCNVIERYAVFVGDFLARHPAGETTQDACDGNARAADDRLAVLHRGVDRNAVRHAAIVTSIFENESGTILLMSQRAAAKAHQSLV